MLNITIVCDQCGRELDIKNVNWNVPINTKVQVDTGCSCKMAVIDAGVRDAYRQYLDAPDGHAQYAERAALIEEVRRYVSRIEKDNT